MLESQGERWSFALKVAVTAALLSYLITKIDLGGLFEKLRATDLFLFAAAFAALAVPISLTSLRWQLILRAQQIVLPYRSAVSYDLIALFFNSFLPGSTGGDAARVIYAISRFPSEKTRIVASIAFDRGIGLLVLLSFGYVAFLTQPELLGGIPAARALALYMPPALGVCLAGVAVFLFLPSSRVPGPVRRWVEAALERAVVGNLVLFLKQQRRRPWVFVAAMGISAASYLFNFLSAYFVAQAMGLEITYMQIIFVIAILYTIISVPISFGGHGVREVVLIALFAGLGFGKVGPEVAVAYSLLLFSVQLLWSLVGGAWFVARRTAAPAGVSTPAPD